jgi:hypothetical protein
MVILEKLDMLNKLKRLKQQGCYQVIGIFSFFSFLILLGAGGCSVPAKNTIPSIPKDHSANKFYQAAQTGMLSDKVCRDDRGDPSIPIGKVEKGEGYTKLEILTAGVFRFRSNATGKKYLGVSFLQYSGFLQIPKVCAWEDKS